GRGLYALRGGGVGAEGRARGGEQHRQTRGCSLGPAREPHAHPQPQPQPDHGEEAERDDGGGKRDQGGEAVDVEHAPRHRSEPGEHAEQNDGGEARDLDSDTYPENGVGEAPAPPERPTAPSTPATP